MRNNPQPYQVYRHFKGNVYQILTLASDYDTSETQVVYQALYSPYKVWVRPLASFMSRVDHEKYPGATQKYRFELLTEPKREETAAGGLKKTVGQSLKKEISDEKKEIQPEPQEARLDPLLVEFLDANTYEEKLNILSGLHGRITNEMINTMAIAMDLEIPEGDIEERFTQLKTCLATKKKYECFRLK